jgi:drug/metabolite transporter (DMT)-like permease
MSWIGFTLMAALMQAVRVAAQKHLAQTMPVLGVTLVRYLYAVPVVSAYLIWLNIDLRPVLQAPSIVWGWIFLGGITQIIATMALISLFRWHNFAVGTTLVKTDLLMTAILGLLLFGLPISWLGWVAIAIGFSGLMTLTWPGRTALGGWLSPALGLGLMAAFFFAIGALAIHRSAQLMPLPTISAAAVVLLTMIVMQIILMVAWIHWRERALWGQLKSAWRPSLFIGTTSGIGSIGWFTAMSLVNPALVKTLGQIEFFFVILITRFFFKEPIRRREWLGIALILMSVFLVMQAA